MRRNLYICCLIRHTRLPLGQIFPNTSGLFSVNARWSWQDTGEFCCCCFCVFQTDQQTHTKSLLVNANGLRSLDHTQPSKNSLHLKQCWSKAAQQHPAYSKVRKNCSLASLRHRGLHRVEWCTREGFYLTQRSIRSLFGDMKEKKICSTLTGSEERHLQLLRSQMKWRISSPSPAGDGGFQGTFLPTRSITFCFASFQAVCAAGWAGKREVGARLDPSCIIWQQRQAVPQRWAFSLCPNSLEQA